MVWSCDRNSVVPSGARRLELLRGDLAAGAGAVVHQHVAAQLGLQLLGQQPRDRVRAAAGRKAHQQVDGGVVVGCAPGAWPGRRRRTSRAALKRRRRESWASSWWFRGKKRAADSRVASRSRAACRPAAGRSPPAARPGRGRRRRAAPGHPPAVAAAALPAAPRGSGPAPPRPAWRCGRCPGSGSPRARARGGGEVPRAWLAHQRGLSASIIAVSAARRARRSAAPRGQARHHVAALGRRPAAG
jgi:hypothetical protein